MGSAEDRSADPQWLAYELHDGLLQWLVSARMNVETVVRGPDGVSAAEASPNPRLLAALSALESALEEGRELIGFLEQPPQDDDHRLGEAIAKYIERMRFEAEQREQTIVFAAEGEHCPPLSSQAAWNVLRIIQQAIRNAVVHAGPCEIAVRCQSDATQLTMSIQDNGSGFDASVKNSDTLTQSGHFGLVSMQHRAKLLGAELTINTSRGQGTTVAFHLPLATT